MKLTVTTLLLIGCSSGPKKPSTPPPVDPGSGDTSMTDEKPAEPDKSMPAPPPEPPAPDTGGYKLVAPSELSYAPLDPSQKDGLQVAVVHGDLKTGATFFLKVPPKMNAGLHTHTSDYAAVVVSGAPRHWLPGKDKQAKPLAAGSFWFQPGGQPHGDECTGTEPCVLFINMPGMFDFAPAPKAKPVKPGKYTLTERKKMKFKPMDPKQPKGPKLAVVYGNPKTGPVGFVIEMPAGANAGLHSHTSDYHALVLDGAPAHWLPHETDEGKVAEVGTYWFQPGGYDHGDRCTSTTPCHAFVYMDKALDFKPAQAAAEPATGD